MSEKVSTRQIKKNIIISIAAQVISLAVSFLANLILPKYIKEYQYAYWQIYLLYISYVGIVHFGILDGIVLRYSQYDYEELDKPRIRSQFKCLLGLTSIFSLIGVGAAFTLSKTDMRIALILVSIGIITRNLFTYTSYSFQITNRIKKYAQMIIVYRLAYGILVTTLIVIGKQEFYWYCIADLIGDVIGFAFGTLNNRGLYLGRSISFRDAIKELKRNISSGIMLMISNWSSFLLTGSARLIIQWHWNELTFGKISFSFSIANLFLTFVSAISIVLFPSLKRADPVKLPALYRQIRNSISPFLIAILILYFPGCEILERWLPRYNVSLYYLGIILPMIVFSSKVSLLTNNYLKAYRAEKRLLIINVISVVLALLLFSFCAYVLDNLLALIACIVVVLGFESIASEVQVMKLIDLKGYMDFVIEVCMISVFIVSAVVLKGGTGFFAYLVALLIYCYIYHEAIVSMVKGIINIIRKPSKTSKP